MQSLRVSASTLRVASGRGVVAALLGVSTAAIPTTAVALCEGGTGGKPSIVVKDDEGNINWNKTLSRIPESAFWDDVGKVTGEGVSGSVCVSVLRRERKERMKCVNCHTGRSTFGWRVDDDLSSPSNKD